MKKYVKNSLVFANYTKKHFEICRKINYQEIYFSKFRANILEKSDILCIFAAE